MNFPTEYEEILKRMESVEPGEYAGTRNYVNGAVTYLSPYISRGVISTKQVFKSVLDRDFVPYHINKFLQELAWRDYWQQIWIAKGDLIDLDLKHPQPDVRNVLFPENINNASTGVSAIDSAIRDMYKTGYMHNHVRMYTASLSCNFGGSHWNIPAQWMYYYLLDADWASNALSWQWVAGSNSNKKYFANQENVNKYCFTNDSGTFLDQSYEELSDFKPVNELKELVSLNLKTVLPESDELKINEDLPTCIYNYYNLDPLWRKEEVCNRIMLLEPSVFDKYPVSEKSIQFALDLCSNIEGIQLFVGEFHELQAHLNNSPIIFKEHPLNKYEGVEDERDWMFSVKGYYASFFTFWKKCRKEMKA